MSSCTEGLLRSAETLYRELEGLEKGGGKLRLLRLASARELADVLLSAVLARCTGMRCPAPGHEVRPSDAPRIVRRQLRRIPKELIDELPRLARDARELNRVRSSSIKLLDELYDSVEARLEELIRRSHELRGEELLDLVRSLEAMCSQGAPPHLDPLQYLEDLVELYVKELRGGRRLRRRVEDAIRSRLELASKCLVALLVSAPLATAVGRVYREALERGRVPDSTDELVRRVLDAARCVLSALLTR